MNKILVTGSTGFIGGHLVNNLLKNKFTIYAIIRNNKKNYRSSRLIKKRNKNFFPIFFKKNDELLDKIKKIKPNILINLATNYITQPAQEEITQVINSNITFPTLVLNACCKYKKLKVINICSVMQCYKNKPNNPENFYALTKILFKKTMSFYKKKYPKNTFINLFIGDTYGSKDKRAKILPVIIKNYKHNRATTILTKNLKLNILHVEDVISAINILIKDIKKSKDFFIKSRIKFNLMNVINKYNSKKNKKVKLLFTDNKISKINSININSIPKWKQKFNVITSFYKDLNENN